MGYAFGMKDQTLCKKKIGNEMECTNPLSLSEGTIGLLVFSSTLPHLVHRVSNSDPVKWVRARRGSLRRQLNASLSNTMEFDN